MKHKLGASLGLATIIALGSASIALAGPIEGVTAHGAAVSEVARTDDGDTATTDAAAGLTHGATVSAIARAHGTLVSARARAQAAENAAAGQAQGADAATTGQVTGEAADAAAQDNAADAAADGLLRAAGRGVSGG
ncbi:MAG: hypothetical protein L0227_08165 [Chloroflexi bacterium]|nr:hypothetical protein [Chloroflexota bacterium]